MRMQYTYLLTIEAEDRDEALDKLDDLIGDADVELEPVPFVEVP